MAYIGSSKHFRTGGGAAGRPGALFPTGASGFAYISLSLADPLVAVGRWSVHSCCACSPDCRSLGARPSSDGRNAGWLALPVRTFVGNCDTYGKPATLLSALRGLATALSPGACGGR